MKRAFSVVIFLVWSAFLFGQDAVGFWKTIDDNTGEAKSIVEIYKGKDGSYHGKVVKLYRKPHEEEDPICVECPKSDYRHRQKIKGMVIISSLEKKGREYEGGEIMDPANGKSYTCKIWTEGPDKLKVRGYLGFFYRTQTWHRVNERM